MNTLVEQNPNKYNLTPKSIKKLKILDWERLQKHTYYNEAMHYTGEWWCHIDGAGRGLCGDSIDEFWIGFNKKNDKIDLKFHCWEGMGNYTFNKFYEIDKDTDEHDIEIQVKAIKWLNKMIDDGILGI